MMTSDDDDGGVTVLFVTVAVVVKRRRACAPISEVLVKNNLLENRSILCLFFVGLLSEIIGRN